MRRWRLREGSGRSCFADRLRHEHGLDRVAFALAHDPEPFHDGVEPETVGDQLGAFDPALRSQRKRPPDV